MTPEEIVRATHLMAYSPYCDFKRVRFAVSKAEYEMMERYMESFAMYRSPKPALPLLSMQVNGIELVIDERI